VGGRIRSIEKSNDLIWNRTRDLPACSIVPQSITLPRGARFTSHSNVKDLLGVRTDLFEVLSMHLPGGTDKDHEKLKSK
jgi:hypothetical protein